MFGLTVENKNFIKRNIKLKRKNSLKRLFYKLKRSSLRREIYIVRTFKIFAYCFLFLTIVYIYCDYKNISFYKRELEREPVDCTCNVPEELR